MKEEKKKPAKTLSQRLREMPFSKVGKGKAYIIPKASTKKK